MYRSLLYISFVFFFFSCSKKEKVLEYTNQYVGNLLINSSYGLKKAKALNESVANITGDVFIVINSNSDISPSEVSEVSRLFKTITGDLIVDTHQSIDFSSLISVSGEYRIFGSDVQDDALKDVGKMVLNYSGDYDYPNIEIALDVILYENFQQRRLAAKGTQLPLSQIDFGNLKKNNTFTCYGCPNGSLFFNTATVIILGEAVSITSITAPSLEQLELKYTGTLPSLSLIVPKIQTLTFYASSITQNLILQGSATASINAPNLSTVGGNVAVSGNSVSFNSLTTVGGLMEIQANTIEQNTGQPHNSGGSTGS